MATRFSREEVRFLSESHGGWATLTAEMRIPAYIKETILLGRARKLGRVFQEFREELRAERNPSSQPLVNDSFEDTKLF